MRTTRETAARALAALFATSWIVLPGFGAIDLAVTWSADWPQVLEAGWGLFFTVLVGAAFVLVAVRPRASLPAAAQLTVATGSLAVSALVAEELRLLWPASALAMQTVIVSRLFRGAWRAGGRAPAIGSRVSAPLLLLAAAGVIPWLTYALDMWASNREDRLDRDLTLGIDHYSVQGALALALAILPFLAARRSELRPFVPACAGVAASYLGLVSFAWPDAAGGLDRRWSVAAMAWGVALLAVALAQHLSRRSASAVEGSGT